MNPLQFSFIFLHLTLLLHFSSAAPALTISVTPKTLSKSGDPVHIQWSGVESPSRLDWLGIYSPSTSPNDHFIGYIFLSSLAGWESGSGTVSIPLVNLRSDYQFRIFRWTESEMMNATSFDQDHNPLPGTEHMLVASEEIGFQPGMGPEHVHLALTGRLHEMRVMFVTPDGKNNTVRYGLTEQNLDQVVGTEVSRYEREDMCHPPANDFVGWRDPGYIHDGVMTNLINGKKYYYQVGSDSGGWSDIFSFVTPKTHSKKTVVFLFGDMGTAAPYITFDRTQEESSSTVKWLLRDIEALGDKPTFISHIGDISYARGYSWLWDQFFHQIQPIASRVPYHVCIGNHEYDWPSQPWKPDWASKLYGSDGGGECGVPYSHRFKMPGNSSQVTGTSAPATRNLFYSLDFGVVHFVYMSTETNFLPGSDQYEFLKNDLESVDRQKTPFVVVQGHRPMYSTCNRPKEIPLRKKMIEHIEPLLVKNKVSLVLWGHVHRYERFCPLNNYTCGSLEKNGEDNWEAYPVHIVIGMGGQDWQGQWLQREDHPSDPVFPQPEQSLFRAGEYGYTKLVATKKKLKLFYIGNHDGKLHDMVEIMAPGVAPSAFMEMEAMDCWYYVKNLSLMVLVGFVAYFLGFTSHCRRNVTENSGWTRLKAEDV
ncbi:OLC1v1032653C1 [Oldenlandia corymbosa var. corymbosa]|uniref:Purple acid phosphatase n=1 Tax=Oldenlandia corymbosa var. corymbosa TaxID=529605 RepID=A0AAV1CLK4_OLDCO|nr:OLC1v1032653C1 [Oldenlandia corymbosa var. corymbosa]